MADVSEELTASIIAALRLGDGGIKLVWNVDPYVPAFMAERYRRQLSSG